MNKYIWIALVAVIIILGISIYFGLTSQKNNKTVTNQNITSNKNVALENENINTNTNASQATTVDSLVVDSPEENDLITSPLVVSGEAKGTWFFEGEFPIKLLDKNNSQIAFGNAIAQGEWMTEDFVPFKATLNFTSKKSEKGILVLAKNNPSGLAENNLEVRIPVNIQSSNTITLKVYFGSTTKDPNAENCQTTYPVERTVPTTDRIATAAIEELLKGPIDTEKDLGYFTSINKGVLLQSILIENGTARVDFNEQLEAGVSGSCNVQKIRSQITETLKQFSTVQNVIISINGNREVLQLIVSRYFFERKLAMTV